MAFKCPDCNRISQNPNDEFHQYCGACHKFFDEPFEPDDPEVKPNGTLKINGSFIGVNRFESPIFSGGNPALMMLAQGMEDCPAEFNEIFFSANIEDLFA